MRRYLRACVGLTAVVEEAERGAEGAAEVRTFHPNRPRVRPELEFEEKKQKFIKKCTF